MIQFTKNTNPAHLRKAYNNDVVELFTNSALEPLHCDITSGTALNIRLYPSPDKKFFLNFRPYITALINTRNFEDTLQPALNNFQESYIYSFTEGSYLEIPVTFTIALEGGTTETVTHNLAWFAAVEQPADYITFLKTSYFLLSPFIKNTTNHQYLKYWQGYPFDISLYHSGETITLRNNTTLISRELTLPGKVSRIVFSDGRTDKTLETFFPMAESFNKLRLMASSTESADDKFITLEKIPYKCGIYLKWLNKYGGYSYWLFENTYAIDRSTKQLGELDRDLSNLEDTYTRAIQIGKESQDTLKVIAELLSEDESHIVQGILDSPKVYLFTGKPFSQNGAHNWVEVALKTGSARIKNARQPLNNFAFDLELPQRYTQTL